MKIIFLDIDGVLVTQSHLESLVAEGKTIHDHFGHLFDPKCVENLRKILEATGAKIVLSSAWRLNGEEYVKNLWYHRALPGEVLSLTGTEEYGRGSQIRKWLSDNGEWDSNFLILDDDISDMWISQQPNIIHTTWKDGLTENMVDSAIEILNAVPDYSQIEEL